MSPVIPPPPNEATCRLAWHTANCLKCRAAKVHNSPDYCLEGKRLIRSAIEGKKSQ